MYLFILIGVANCQPSFDYQDYGDYGQYGPFEVILSILKIVQLCTDNPSSGNVGPLVVPSMEYELVSVWVHRRRLTLVDVMMQHQRRSFAAALTKPLTSFMDRFSIGGANAASAPVRTGAPSDDADPPASSGACSKRPSGSNKASTPGASFKRPSEDVRADASASASADDVLAGVAASASSDGVFGRSPGEGVETSGLGGPSTGTRLAKYVVLGGGRSTLEFDVCGALLRARGWCYVMNLFLFVFVDASSHFNFPRFI